MSLLEAVHITKSFGGVRALKSVTFDLRAGEVHALVGENGAGKSTLIKVLTGALQPDSGEIRLNGQVVTHNTPAEAKARGIAAIYQQPALFPDLSVAENIAVARGSGNLWQRINWKERRRHAGELLESMGAKIDPNAPVSSLTMPEQQLLEIAKALDANAQVLIMDEPTASLGDHDVENLMRIVHELRMKQVGIIYISHRFDEIFRLGDRVTVLRDGTSIDTRPMESVNPPDLIRMMVGRELSTVFPERNGPLGETVLEVEHLSCRASGVKNVSLSVRGGEILGIAGLVGAGRTQFAEALFGLVPADGGEIRVHGQSAKIDAPAKAMALGIAYVPEDRRRNGLVMEMPVSQNTTLASLRNISKNGFLQFGKEAVVSEEWRQRMRTKTDSVDTPVKNLSGGNQQKVSLARWLMTSPKILILDEPTQGIDVGAKSEIYRLMAELAGQGMAVIMISSELPEVLGMSDRIAVMHAGEIVKIVSRAEATSDLIMELALGHTQPITKKV